MNTQIIVARRGRMRIRIGSDHDDRARPGTILAAAGGRPAQRLSLAIFGESMPHRGHGTPMQVLAGKRKKYMYYVYRASRTDTCIHILLAAPFRPRTQPIDSPTTLRVDGYCALAHLSRTSRWLNIRDRCSES